MLVDDCRRPADVSRRSRSWSKKPWPGLGNSAAQLYSLLKTAARRPPLVALLLVQSIRNGPIRAIPAILAGKLSLSDNPWR